MRFLFALLATIAILGIASVNGWLTFASDDSSVSVTVDKNEVRKDADAVAKEADKLADDVGDAVKAARDSLEEPESKESPEGADADTVPAEPDADLSPEYSSDDPGYSSDEEER